MKKHILWSVLFSVLLIFAILMSIEESRTFIIAIVVRVFVFAKKNIIALLVAFFLVKGKFILLVFLKKIAFLSATGLGKRYLIEKVINHNLKIHFLDHIKDDSKKLMKYIKENFKDFPIVKQIMAGLVFLGSLSFVGKFMGGMLAMKVFIAKFWSFILAIVLKFSTGILYFFTDYLWGSWFAPILEVLLFSWLFEWLEKIPFLKKYFVKMYAFFVFIFGWIEGYLEKIFHSPTRNFFRYLTKKIKKKIYAFIGEKRRSSAMRLKELRAYKPSKQKALNNSRVLHKEKHAIQRCTSTRESLKEKRDKRKTFKEKA